jgi:hypothetical protein
MSKTTDINDAAAPEEVPVILRRNAERANEAAGELAAAWGDSNAGKPWLMIAKELERCAAAIEKKLP